LSAIYATSSTANCAGSSSVPAGHCIQSFTPSSWPVGTWSQFGGAGAGAEQVTLDPTNTILGPYVLDSGGVPWHWNTVTSSWNNLGDAKCGGGSLAFVQMATKYGTAFAMNWQGTVFWLPFLGTCWTQVGTKTDFASSIATDNGTFTSVWAVSQTGQIWTAN
jgi:hypothetical protein